MVNTVCERSENIGVNKRSSWPNDLTHCQASRFQTAIAHDVENGFATGDKIVGNDPAVTAPPHRFGTHDRAALLVPFLAQML